MPAPFHERVRQNFSRLTKSQATLSEYILQNIEEVAFFSSTSLARRVQVSEATVTRFCLALGYSGYSEFQKDMQKLIQIKLAPSERFEKSSRRKEPNFCLEVFNQDLKTMKETLESLSLADIREAARLISTSQRVFIIGLRNSFGAAYLLYHQLCRILRSVKLLDTSYGMLYDPVVDVGSKDLLVAISFLRYSKGTLQVAEYFKKRGARIIALTDSVLSPLALISNLIIPLKIGHPAFFASYTNVIYVINCLSVGTSLANSKRSVRVLKDVEANIPKSETWVTWTSTKK